MRKLLRFSLLLLTILTCSFAKAADVSDVFTASALGIKGTNYADLKDLKLTSAAKYSLNASTNNETCVQLRAKSNSGIVTTATGGTVKSITIKWNKTTYEGRKLDIYGKTEAYTAPADLYDTKKQGTKLGTIEYGKSTELVIDGNYTFIGLRSTSGALYADEITITWATSGEASLAAPTISGTTHFETSTEVSLKADDGAKIYYTTDGQTPTTASTLYTAPFTLNESATVSAIAVKDGKTSTVSTKAFAKVAFTTLSFDEVCALPTNAAKQYIKLELENAKVVYVDGTTVFLRQDGQGMMLYNVNQKALTLNATVSGTIKLDFKPYYDLPEMVANSFTNSDDLTVTTSSSTELDAVETTVADLLAKKHLCDLVVLKGATITSEGSGTSTNYYIVSGESKIQLWGNQSLSKAGVGKALDIYAVCNSIHSGAVQIKPVKVGDITLGIDGTLVAGHTAAKGVYTIGGVKMGNEQALPTGLYIVNGKKVIVNNK